ncbi:MAG: MFS transporter [Holosporaceae bacterium]
MFLAPPPKKSLSLGQFFCFVFFGLSSGLPFLMIVSTLAVCLIEKGVSPSLVGFSTVATLPYALKFFLSPLIDSFWLPYLSQKLGQRRCCALFFQFGVVCALAWLGSSLKNPSLWQTGLAALCVSFFATLQDLVLEVYRIEQTPRGAMGASAFATTFGFRLGVLISGAGALFAAHFLSWRFVYHLVAGCAFLAMTAVLLSRKDQPSSTLKRQQKKLMTFSWVEKWRLSARHLFQRHFWGTLLVVFVLAKMADVVLHTMSIPFLLSLGYSKTLYATVAKIYGFGALLVGSTLCGFVLDRTPLYNVFVVALALQLGAVLCFLLQALWPPHQALLTITVLFESLASGFLTTLLVAYMSRLSKAPYTTMQYGMLASLSSLIRIGWSLVAGATVACVPWSLFFSGLLGLQSAIMVFFLTQKKPLQRRYSPRGV